MLACMNPITRIIDMLTPAYRAATDDAAGSSVTPPPRLPAGRDAMHFSPVFRAVQILETSIAGLPVRQLRRGVEMEQDAIIARPDPNMFRSEFVMLTVSDLAVRGEAFWLKLRGVDGTVKGLRCLPASLVSITNLTGDISNPVKQYGYLGSTIRDEDMFHLKFVTVAGRMHGIGPIEAARTEIDGAMDARDAKAMWFTEPSQPSGILSTDKMINDEIAQTTKDRFEKNKRGVKVVGGGMTYTPLILSPAEMQYLETQRFDTTQIARLFGIPSSLMLAAQEGSNLTYSNVEQEWMQFADFTLAAYTRPMEEALSACIARGQSVDFTWDSFRRSDTKTRFETHKIAIEAHILTVDEVRRMEGYPPMEGQGNDD